MSSASRFLRKRPSEFNRPPSRSDFNQCRSVDLRTTWCVDDVDEGQTSARSGQTEESTKWQVEMIDTVTKIICKTNKTKRKMKNKWKFYKREINDEMLWRIHNSIIIDIRSRLPANRTGNGNQLFFQKCVSVNRILNDAGRIRRMEY
jgi:hypothetical protein